MVHMKEHRRLYSTILADHPQRHADADERGSVDDHCHNYATPFVEMHTPAAQ